MLPRLGKVLFHSEAEIDQHRQHHGDHREDDQGQGNAHGAENDKGTNDLDSRDEEFLGAVMGELGHVKKVGGDTRHQGSDLGVVVVREGELLQMRKEISSHVGLDLCAHDMTNGCHIIIGGGVDDPQDDVNDRAFQYQTACQVCYVIGRHAGYLTNDQG